MKSSKLILLAVFVLLMQLSATAQTIVNIDFLEQRGSEVAASNYVGSGPTGGGTTYNGLAANDSSDSDQITVSGTDLLDSNGLPTIAGFSISPIGADNEPTLPDYGVVNSGYLFLDSANATNQFANFTFSGLGLARTANLFFTTTNNTPVQYAQITFTGGGGSQIGYTTSGIFTNANTFEFVDVPVSGGKITGSFGRSGDLSLLSGVTIEGNGLGVPEPSTYAMASVGLAFLLALARRRNSLTSSD